MENKILSIHSHLQESLDSRFLKKKKSKIYLHHKNLQSVLCFVPSSAATSRPYKHSSREKRQGTKLATLISSLGHVSFSPSHTPPQFISPISPPLKIQGCLKACSAENLLEASLQIIFLSRSLAEGETFLKILEGNLRLALTTASKI